MKKKTKAKAAPGAPPLPKAGRYAPSGARTLDISSWKGGYTQLGYKAATAAIRDGRVAMGGSGDQHMRYQREQLVHQSREFIRDNGLYRGMIDRATSYIVGNGFTLQASTSDREWNALVEKWWRKVFWRKPEIRGVLSGRRTEKQVCRELLTCGDVAAIKVKGGKLQLVESEQIVGPGLKDDGLRKNRAGTITGFYLANYTKDGYVRPADATVYGVEDVLFMSDPERPSAARAVPPAQASFPMLHRINDVCDSEAAAWQILSKWAISINRAGGAAGAVGISKDEVGLDAEGKLTTRVTELDYATIFSGEPGEDVKGIDRNIPGKDFPASITMFLRLLGLPLGLPLEIILLDWTKSNYSQSRAVLEQAYTTFQGWQGIIEEDFLDPTYEWAVPIAIATGELRAPKLAEGEDLFAHEWIKPTFPWIDQLAEADAKGAMLDRGFTTLASVVKSTGKDLEDIWIAREREAERALEISARLKAKYGVEVPYQVFFGIEHSKDAIDRKDGESDKAAKEPSSTEGDQEAKAAPVAAAPPPPRPVRVVKRVLARDDKGRIDQWSETPEYGEGD
jgi:lambda family phage portal protein